MSNDTIFSFSILAEFQHLIYDTLLYEHHLSRGTAKQIDWKNGAPPVTGYIFTKDNKNYLLSLRDEDNKDTLEKLPIRIKEVQENIAVNGDVIYIITKYSSLKIVPEKLYNFYDFVNLDNIQHGNMEAWVIWKIIAHASRCGRLCVRACGVSEFGKSSYFKVLNSLLNKMYVITRPKSVPGICKGITRDGTIVIDEVAGDLASDHRKSIGDMLFQFGDMANKVKSGTAGSLAHGTKSEYDTPKLSCVIIYNPISYYQDRSKFFDYMFNNSTAINNRFLPLSLPEGKLDVSQFSSTKYSGLKNEWKELFISYMKTAKYYRENWKELIDFPYIKEIASKRTRITGRHMDSYLEICCFLYLYAKDSPDDTKTTFEHMEKLLYSMNQEYYDMLNTMDGFEELTY